MRRVITIGSQKGGVGKSTTVLNLGYSLSRLGHRVLLVDGDPQNGMSIATNLGARAKGGLLQVLRGEIDAEEAVAFTRDRSLAGLNTGIASPEDVFFLEAAAGDNRLLPIISAAGRGFDFVLIDAPAGVGALVYGLLAASQGVLLVARCQNVCLRSVPTFLRTVELARKRANPDLRLIGALMNMRRDEDPVEQKLHAEFVGLVPADALFQTEVPWDPFFEEASQRAVPAAWLRGGQSLAQRYLDLAFEVKQRTDMGTAQGETDDDVQGLF
jgi:chromosome partitioning protein